MVEKRTFYYKVTAPAVIDAAEAFFAKRRSMAKTHLAFAKRWGGVAACGSIGGELFGLFRGDTAFDPALWTGKTNGGAGTVYSPRARSAHPDAVKLHNDFRDTRAKAGTYIAERGAVWKALSTSEMEPIGMHLKGGVLFIRLDRTKPFPAWPGFTEIKASEYPA